MRHEVSSLRKRILRAALREEVEAGLLALREAADRSYDRALETLRRALKHQEDRHQLLASRLLKTTKTFLYLERHTSQILQSTVQSTVGSFELDNTWLF